MQNVMTLVEATVHRGLFPVLIIAWKNLFSIEKLYIYLFCITADTNLLATLPSNKHLDVIYSHITILIKAPLLNITFATAL